MARQLSKADRIRKILHLSNKEIARRTGCAPAYVRAVRQRTSDAGNPITDNANRNWVAANKDRVRESHRKSRAKRYSTDPEYRSLQLERHKKWRERNPDYYRVYMAKRRAEARAS